MRNNTVYEKNYKPFSLNTMIYLFAFNQVHSYVSKK